MSGGNFGDFIGVMARPKPGYNNAAVEVAAVADVQVAGIASTPPVGSGGTLITVQADVVVGGSVRPYRVRGQVEQEAVASVLAQGSTIGGTPYSQIVRSQNPWFYATFDGETMQDDSGNNRAAVFNNLTIIEGLVGPKAAAFNSAQTSHIGLPLIPASMTSFTVEAWMRWDIVQRWSRLFDFSNGAGSNNIFLSVLDSEQLTLQVYNQFGVAVDVRTPYHVVRANEWMHIAGVVDNGYYAIYVNGALIAQSTTTVANAVDRTQNYFGRAPWVNEVFNGAMDEPAIYPYRLSDAQLHEHYLAVAG